MSDKNINMNQIAFVNPSFVDDEVPPRPVDVTGFPVTTSSSDETIAKWDRFDATGNPDPAGEYGVRSFSILGEVTVTYAVTNPDNSVATITGTLAVIAEDAVAGSMNFGRVINVPAVA